jgi:hypothetical protein
MKKIAMMIVSLATATMMQAQNPHGRKDMADQDPASRAKHEAEKAAKTLTLTADQQASWENAARDRITQNAPIADKLKGSTTPTERKELRKQMDANFKQFETMVTGMLTPDQKKKFDATKEERKEKMEERHEHHHKNK